MGQALWHVVGALYLIGARESSGADGVLLGLRAWG
jgi:hypothetical protein